MRKKDLTFIDILQKSFHIYCENIFSWLIICILVYMPMNICRYLALKNILQSVRTINLFHICMNFLPIILFEPLGIAAISFIVQQNLFHKKIIMSEVLDNSLMKWRKLIIATTLYYLIVLLTSTLVLPAIYFFVSFYFYATIIALSEFDGMRAMLISRISLLNRWFKAAGLIFVSITSSVFISFFLVRFIPNDIGNYFAIKLLFNFVIDFIDIFFKIILVVWFLSIATIKIDEGELSS